MGLTLSGKTSIRQFMQHQLDFKKYGNCQPTIDYERFRITLGDREITGFDLGGTGFLDRFTGELSEFIFSAVKSLVFVVDSINIREVSQAKYYFDLALKRLMQYSPTARVFVFQHKVDLIPKDMKVEVQQTIEKHLLSGLELRNSKSEMEFIQGIFRPKNGIVFYQTSVFTASMIQAVDAVMSWMSDGDLHLYHQQV